MSRAARQIRRTQGRSLGANLDDAIAILRKEHAEIWNSTLELRTLRITRKMLREAPEDWSFFELVRAAFYEARYLQATGAVLGHEQGLS